MEHSIVWGNSHVTSKLLRLNWRERRKVEKFRELQKNSRNLRKTSSDVTHISVRIAQRECNSPLSAILTL